MPRLNEMFPSTYIKAADLADAEQVYTIDYLEQAVVGQGDDAENKWVVYFVEIAKGLVLNKTNANSLAACFGDDTDDWVQHKVVLYPTEVAFSGKMVEAIRVKEKATRNLNKPAPAAKPAAAPKAATVKAAPAGKGEAYEGDVDPAIEDEDIPF